MCTRPKAPKAWPLSASCARARRDGPDQHDHHRDVEQELGVAAMIPATAATAMYASVNTATGTTLRVVVNS